MEDNLIKYIWKYSKRQQVILVLLTLLSFPILYMTLELPKWIINDALGDPTGRKTLLGFTFEAIPYLAVLCFALLSLIVINGILKMRINTFKGIIGERLVRRLRYNLITNTLRFPLRYFSRISSGELISTVTAETEPLGGYIGESFALPLFEGGTMITILVFMFAQDWVFGLVSVAFIPVQGYVIPKLQHQVNLLRKERIRQVRKLSERIGETVVGATEIRLHGTQPYTLSEFSHRLGDLFKVRLEIFKKKFFMKFLNNTIGHITPFLFYLFGGYLVIKGDLTIGALVAALAAYKDLTSPWRELLNFYQLHEDSKIKYQQIIELFNPEKLVEVNQVETESEPLHLSGDVSVRNVSWRNEQGEPVLSGINLEIEAGSMVAITGDHPIRRARLAQLLCALDEPSGGRILIDGKSVDKIPDSVLRRRLTLQGPDPHMFAGTIVENIEYGLNQHEPDIQMDSVHEQELKDAAESGNRPPIDTGWLDYRQAGAPERARSADWYQQVIKATGSDRVVYERSLLEVFDPEEKPELAAKLLRARGLIRTRLASLEDKVKVALFDPDNFNPNASISENILYGVAIDERLDDATFSIHPYIIQILEKENLVSRALTIGLETATNLVNMVDENTLSHEMTEHFGLTDDQRIEDIRFTVDNFISQENLSFSCYCLLLSLFLLVIPERHRFVYFDARLSTRLLQARREFTKNLPAELSDAVLRFEETRYHPKLTVQDNLLFGRLPSQDPAGARRVNRLIEQVVDEMDLRKDLILLLGESQVGIRGSRLPLIAKHRISLGRALVKNPDILIFHDALGPMDSIEQAERRREIRQLLPQTTIIWIAREIHDPEEFDRVYRFTEAGPLIATDGIDDAGSPSPATPARRSSNTLELISSTILFSELSPSQQRYLADHSRLVSVGADQVIYEMGDEADAAWLVVSGEVVTHNSEPEIVGRFRRPEVFGAIEVLADCPRILSARTTADSMLLRIDDMAIETVALSDARVSRTLLRSLTQQWRN